MKQIQRVCEKWIQLESCSTQQRKIYEVVEDELVGTQSSELYASFDEDKYQLLETRTVQHENNMQALKVYELSMKQIIIMICQ